jgi:hypothetical protein
MLWVFLHLPLPTQATVHETHHLKQPTTNKTTAMKFQTKQILFVPKRIISNLDLCLWTQTGRGLMSGNTMIWRNMMTLSSSSIVSMPGRRGSSNASVIPHTEKLWQRGQKLSAVSIQHDDNKENKNDSNKGVMVSWMMMNTLLFWMQLKQLNPLTM